jgi:hypothetical protein
VPIYVKLLTINVSVYGSVPIHKNYRDIKLLLMVRAKDHLQSGWLGFIRQSSLADKSAGALWRIFGCRPKRQKHFSALNGAPATGCKAPGL